MSSKLLMSTSYCPVEKGAKDRKRGGSSPQVQNSIEVKFFTKSSIL